MVAMDMRKAFIPWGKELHLSVQIVFDHFHVIKRMNEKLDFVRRRIPAELDAEERPVLKDQCFTLLRNEKSLSSEASAYRTKIRQPFQEPLWKSSITREEFFFKSMDAKNLNICVLRFSICRTTMPEPSFEVSFSQTAEEAKSLCPVIHSMSGMEFDAVPEKVRCSCMFMADRFPVPQKEAEWSAVSSHS